MTEQTPIGGFQAQEVAALAERYGQPLLVEYPLHLQRFLEAAAELPPKRVAEVVPVIMRPDGRVVTMIKTFYPPGAYRLPSGGIRAGEKVLDALQREVYEETGLRPHIRRFLAVIRYRVFPADGRETRFTSYAFHLESDQPLQTIDPDEHVLEFREVPVPDLRRMADFLDHLGGPGRQPWPGEDGQPANENVWPDWGRFRAVAHRVVADLLENRTQGTKE